MARDCGMSKETERFAEMRRELEEFQAGGLSRQEFGQQRCIPQLIAKLANCIGVARSSRILKPSPPRGSLKKHACSSCLLLAMREHGRVQQALRRSRFRITSPR